MTPSSRAGGNPPEPADEGGVLAHAVGPATAAGAAPNAGPTERLYYTDAYLRTFTARVGSAVPLDGGRAGVVLDRTAFYPTSGGQPHDTGTLAGVRVADVIDRPEGIVHVPAGAPDRSLAPGTEVQGVVDWDRRYDHMQQHTAQHILSAACLEVLGAETVSVHLGESSTVDLGLADLSADGAARVEDAVAGVVFENRPVTVRFVDAADASALGLRKIPARTGTLRIVEVEGYDRSACGGTHVRGAAEVGPVLIRRWERTRGRIRVEFLAGWRALRDYRWKHALVSDWSTRLTVRDRELGDALARQAALAEEREGALAEARRRLLSAEAAEHLAAAPAGPHGKVLRLEFADRNADEVRLLLRELTARERCVVLAGILASGRVYLARSPGEGPDLARVLARAAEATGGRGGGTAEFAQGAWPPQDVPRALGAAAEALAGA